MTRPTDPYAQLVARLAELRHQRAELMRETETLAYQLARLAVEEQRLEKEIRLRIGARPGSVSSGQMLTQSHRVALARKQQVLDPKFAAHIRAKENGEWTLRGLAKAAAISRSALSQARRPPGDPLSRPIRRSKARRIYELTHWPVDQWPGGVIDD